MDGDVCYTILFLGALYNIINIKQFTNIQVSMLVFIISVSIKSDYQALSELILMIILPYLIISLGECKRPIFKDILKKYDLSYGIFLYGFPIQQILIHECLKVLKYIPNGNFMFVIALILSCCCAFVSFRYIENPVQQKVKKIIGIG